MKAPWDDGAFPLQRLTLEIKSSQFDSRATLSISSCDGSLSVPSRPYMIFRLMERAKRVGSCCTIEIC